MKKQGPPAPLDESKITMLKKRKSGSAEAPPKAASAKRRRSDADEPVTKKDAPKKKKVNVAANVAPTKPVKADKKKQSTKPKPVPVPMSDDDEDMEDLDDEEFGDLDGVSEGSMDSDDRVEGLSDLEDDDDNSVIDSDDEGHTREAMFSDDEDMSDAEERLTAANIEGLSRKLDLEQQAEEEEAEAELQEAALQTNIAGPDVFADQSQQGLAPDLQLLRQRITDTIRIMGDLKTLGQAGKSRADYIDLLLNDICTYYGYTRFLAEKLFNLFTPMEAFAFFEANETPRPVVIRTNTLRTNRRSLAQALINRGVVLEPVGKWSKVGLQVFESPVPLGATPEYLAGHYILQAASSFLPVMALAPQPNERVLDMASAPGGKTTYMSALMRNTGCVIANDASKPRAKGLIGNIHRLGCKNTVVTHMDARTAFPKALGGFDRVLLDAPCTGTGVISKDPGVKTSKNERDFLAIPHMQRQLLLAAIDSVDHASKTGGYIVYSTCSVTVEENEAVVQYVLRKRPNVKIVDTGLGDFGSPGFLSYMGKKFDAKMALTRRYFPHRENVDGFYVCKLKKTAVTPVSKTDDSASSAPAKSGSKSARSAASAASTDDDEVYDKTPIVDENGDAADFEGGAFASFEDPEDTERIARAERNRIRRKGLNPKGVLNKPKKSNSEAAPKTSESVPPTKEEENKTAVSKKSTNEGKGEKKTVVKGKEDKKPVTKSKEEKKTEAKEKGEKKDKKPKKASK
jgi:ribosomal RNA methyltransferase Nop2